MGVDSEEGKGSTFWFKLPASQSAANASGQAQPVQSVTQRRLPEAGESWQLRLSQMRGSRKFSVLQQGLVIISIPLIFEMGFGFWIGHLLNQVSQQIHREEDSIDLLGLLNRGEEQIFVTSADGSMYLLTRNESYWKEFHRGMDKLFGFLDRAEKFCAADPEEKKDLEECRDCLVRCSAAAEKAAALHDDKVEDPHDSSMAAMLERSRFFSKDADFSKSIYSIFQVQKAQERLMARERVIGENLSAQRVQMIKGLEHTLYAGIVLNLLMSVLLAVILMRHLSFRLQHVMSNTARLVKREALDPPLAGGDEIAYLDRILFEIGNQLLQLEKFKQDLIAIVSHELRTPLMSISSALELFDVGALGELSEEGKNRLVIASSEAHRLIRLITNLLDIEKMDAGEFILDCSEFKVSDLVQSSIASVGSLAEAKKIKLEPFVADPNMSVYADRDRISQVLRWLLSHAINSSPEDGSVKVSVERGKNDQLRFCVVDRGAGIPETIGQKIFDRFVQADGTDASERGSDLGLTIAKAIVERHGGTIGVDSELGSGCTFWFQLPVNKDGILK
jgi:signal transduction histidine kinase